MDNSIYVAAGKLISIRKITWDDTDLVVAWRNNKRIRDHFIYRVEFTREIHENWLRTKVDTGEVAQFIICENSRDGRPVGSVYFRYTDKTKNEAEYGIFIGEDDAVGKGYGSETAQVAVKYAKEVLGIKRIILRVFAYNKVAIRSYEKAGFRKYSDLPAVECSDGQKSDMILMENC